MTMPRPASCWRRWCATPTRAPCWCSALGCENLTHEQFLEELGDYDHDRVKFLICQDVEDELAAGREILKELAAYAGQFRREPIPASELVVGMKCGGSDGLSGNHRQPHHRPLQRYALRPGRFHRAHRGARDVRRRGLPDGPLPERGSVRQGCAHDQRLQGILHQPQRGGLRQPQPRQQTGRHHHAGGQELRLRPEGRQRPPSWT